MPARSCGLLVLCLCFARVSLGADPPKQAKLAQRPNEILCNCKFVWLTAKAAAEFDAGADLVTLRSPQSFPPPVVMVYKNAEKALRELRKSRMARIHEFEPTAATVDKPATVRTGGEFPILIPTGSSNRVSIEWKKFGYGAEVVPHWLDTGRLQLQVTPEIVTKDMKHAVVASGLMIPGLTTRRAYARVEMNLGETAVVNLGSDPENEDEADTIPRAVTLFMATPVAANSSSN